MIYSFVVLVKMPDLPSPQEWVVILYIFTSAIEKIREVRAADFFFSKMCIVWLYNLKIMTVINVFIWKPVSEWLLT